MPSLERLRATVRHLFRNLLRRDRVEHELDQELSGYLEMMVAEKEATGLSPAEARRAARLEFGGVDQVKEHCRDARRTRWLEDLGRDLRFGGRDFRRCPGFTAAVLLIVALGVGAATAIFSVANAVLIRPLPYPEAGRLVSVVRLQLGGLGRSHDRRASMFLYDHATSFSDVAVIRTSPGLNLVSQGGSEYVRNLRVSSGYLRVLAVPLALGRDFTPQDERDASTVILSHGLWIRHFGESPNVVGQAVRLGGRPHTVIGVASPALRSFPPVDLWTPFPFRTDPQGAGLNYELLARLRPDRTSEAAQSELHALTPLLNEQHPNAVRDFERLGVLPYQQVLGQDMVPVLILLSAAVGIFLLIVCSNTAGLLATRAVSRHREFAVRTALGGSGGRLVRQLLTESLILAVAGGALGVAVAAWGIDALLSLRPSTAAWAVTMDARVLLTAVSLSLLTGAIFGIAPAVQAWQTSVTGALHGSGDRASRGRRAALFRRSLVVGQVALCTVLLVTAGLFVDGLRNLTRVELGFNPSGVLTAQASLQDSAYTDTAAVARLYQRTLDDIRGLPGVAHAAVANNLPVERGLNLPIHSLHGSVDQPVVSVDWRYVTEDYFATMDIPLVGGRAFDEHDNRSGQPVALVNEAFVRQFVGDAPGIGSQIQIYEFAPAMKDDPRTIVGIVGDVTSGGTLAGPPIPTMFVPIDQVPDAILAAAHSFFQVNWVVRTRGRDAQLIPQIEDTIRRIDPQLPVSGFRTMEQVIGAAVTDQRFQGMLLTLFAVAALALAAAGLYGVIAFATTQRTREVGIRLALGETTGQVRARFVGEGLRLGSMGTALGLGATPLLTRLLQGLLVDVPPSDLPTLGGVAALLLTVSLVAAYVPARRATIVDPMAALRLE